MVNTVMKLRLAEIKDSLNILQWRNDPHTRAMSRHEDLIEVKDHSQWYEKSLQNPKRLLLVGELEDNAVGMVRFDRLQNAIDWEVSITLAPNYRGRGLSKNLLELACSCFISQYSNAGLIAEIKRCNTTSRRLFEGYGFKCISNEGDMLRYFYQPRVIGNLS
jgi:RimJ/RimL family protein N-acetyltransferase